MAKEKLDEQKTQALETFIPAVTFTGFPDDRPRGVKFFAGVESIPVPPEFVALMREKKLVADK